jgi:hypothetical protein
MSLEESWKTNYFTYSSSTITDEDLNNIPLLDIVRGNIILAQLDGSGNISNNPTAFFILTTSKISNINNLGNVPQNAYQQFMLVQGNSKTFGTTSGSVPNGQNNSKFYFTPFSSQILDLVPLYAIYDSVTGGIEFFRADIFTNNFINYMTANPEFRPNINSLTNPIGTNETTFVYLCSSNLNNYDSFVYSEFLTKSEIDFINGNTGISFSEYRTTYTYNELKSNNRIIPGVKYTPNNVYASGTIRNINFLTSLGGTVSGGSSNNTNVNMGFQNSIVFYQNDPTNYIGTYYNNATTNNWSINQLVNTIGGQKDTGLTNYMVFQFIPLTYLTNPGLGNVSLAPSYLNLTYPTYVGPPSQPYPISIPNLNLITYATSSVVTNTIYNWYNNTQAISCGTKVISGGYCGFTPQYYYNSLQGVFYNMDIIPDCLETFDPPSDVTDITAGTIQGYSKSCNDYYGSGTFAACVPNFYYDLEVTAPPFICGPVGKKFDSVDEYAMEYTNFINYFAIIPPSVPYSLTSSKPQPYIDTAKISQNTQGTPKTTFWNSSFYIVLAIIIFILIIGIVVYFMYKQGTKKEQFPKYLNKYYS